MRKNIELIQTRSVYTGKVFSVSLDEVRLPGGGIVERAVVEHPGAVVILPQLEDGMLLLTYQYRHAVRDTLYEFPAGTLEAGETPRECAEREIKEEVGHRATKWVELGSLYPAPGFCNEKQHCFFASGLFPEVVSGDEDEIIEVKKMSVDEVQKLIIDGQMVDAKSIAIFFRAKVRGLF